MTADGWTSGVMSYKEVHAMVKRAAKARHEHHAGITIFGWAISFGIFKTTSTHKPSKRVWWN